jgi:membrane-bound serine protease (ClpP class)
MNYVAWTLKPAGGLRALGTQLLIELQQEDLSWRLLPLEGMIHEVLGIITAVAVISIVLFVGGICLSKTRLFRSMTLSAVQSAHQGYTARTYPDSLIGLKGMTQTPLRPAGKVTIDGVCYDAKTLGTYVASGVAVVVTSVSGTSLTVQAIHRR